MSWKVLAESAVGTSHQRTGLPCQDACVWAKFGFDDQWLAIAVADGAGSASHSQVAAKLVCEGLVNSIGHELFEVSWTHEQAIELLLKMRLELQDLAHVEGHALRDYACTVLLAVIGPESSLFVQLGDGAIVLQDQVVFWPEPAEYANMTDFLTDDNFASTVQFRWHTGTVQELAVLTDGLQRLALDYSTKTPHPRFFQPLFRRIREAEDVSALQAQFADFLNSSAVNARTDDDKTLVLAVRYP